jgi:hypothetical protein
MAWNREHFSNPRAALTVEEVVSSSGSLFEIKSRCCIEGVEMNMLFESALTGAYFVLLCVEVSHKIQAQIYKGGTGLVYLKSVLPTHLEEGDVLFIPNKPPVEVRPNSYW